MSDKLRSTLVNAPNLEVILAIDEVEYQSFVPFASVAGWDSIVDLIAEGKKL